MMNTGHNDLAFFCLDWYGLATSSTIQNSLFKAARKLNHAGRHLEIFIGWILHPL